jgi:predicted nuclease of predicted toxin-antitoxin system
MSARLLFDENLPPGPVADLADMYPDSVHVRDLALPSASDAAIWPRASTDGFVIVTKDDDFRQRSFLYGAPPKVIWVRLGHCRRSEVADVLRHRVSDVQQFVANTQSALSVLNRRL